MIGARVPRVHCADSCCVINGALRLTAAGTKTPKTTYRTFQSGTLTVCTGPGWSTSIETSLTVNRNMQPEWVFLPRHPAMLARSWESRFCLSVRHTGILWQNEIKYCRYCNVTWKGNHSSFLTSRGIGKDVRFCLKFSLKMTHPFEKRRFRQISVYNVSTVKASEKYYKV